MISLRFTFFDRIILEDIFNIFCDMKSENEKDQTYLVFICRTSAHNPLIFAM